MHDECWNGRVLAHNRFHLLKQASMHFVRSIFLLSVRPRIQRISQRQHECHQVFFLLGSQLRAENQIEELDGVVQGH